MTSAVSKFQTGSLAFYWLCDRLKAVSIDSIKHSSDEGFTYMVARNGLSFIMHETELLSGWEPDFPAWEHIDWSNLLDDEDFSGGELYDDKLEEVGFPDEWQWWEDEKFLEELEREYVLA